jgi:tetratricopeptide (TPR) repeat protein
MRNETMKKRLCIAWIALSAALVYANGGKEAESAPVSPGDANRAAQAEMESALSEEDGLSLDEAIEQSAAEIAADLPAGSRVAIVGFSSEHESLSEYIMDELTGALVDGGLEVADRRNLAYVYKELGFQMSGDVSDESALSIGKFLAAEYVVLGQLIKAGGRYRYRLSGINVETAALAGSVRLDVRDSRAMTGLIADLRSAKVSSPVAYKPPAAAPGNAGAFLDRGILFATRHDFELAIEDFTEAIRLDDKLAAAYVFRGRAYAAGASHVLEIGEKFSDFRSLMKNYVNLTADQKDAFDKAIADDTRAIQLDPKLAAAYYDRGFVYNSIGDYDKAIADYNQAIRLNPNSANTYNRRGIAYRSKGDYGRAIADYNQAINLEPNLAETYANRGAAYRSKGNHDRAIADYNQAIRLGLNFASAYYGRGDAYHNKGDYDRAIADYNQAINLEPNLAEAYANRGATYDSKGDYNRSIADYNQAIDLNPNATGVYTNRGAAYYGKGDYSRARADWEKALQIDPNNQMARNNLEALQ